MVIVVIIIKKIITSLNPITILLLACIPILILQLLLMRFTTSTKIAIIKVTYIKMQIIIRIIIFTMAILTTPQIYFRTALVTITRIVFMKLLLIIYRIFIIIIIFIK